MRFHKGTILEVQGYWESYLHFAKYGDELRELIFVATQPSTLKSLDIFY